MAKFLDKVLIKTGLQSQKQKFDLSSQNLTTQEFYQMKPIYFKEMIPGEKLVMDLSAFTRLSPLVNPMLGNVRIINRAFFVPMRTVWREWNDYITTNISSTTGTKITSVPNLKNSGFVAMFSSLSNKLAEKITDAQTIEDIERGNGALFSEQGFFQYRNRCLRDAQYSRILFRQRQEPLRERCVPTFLLRRAKKSRFRPWSLIRRNFPRL